MANVMEELWQKFEGLPTWGKIGVVAGAGGVVLLIWQPWKSSSSSTGSTSLTTATPLDTSSSGVASGVGSSQTGSNGFDPSQYPWLDGSGYTLTGSTSSGSSISGSTTGNPTSTSGSATTTSGLSNSTTTGTSTISTTTNPIQAVSPAPAQNISLSAVGAAPAMALPGDTSNPSVYTVSSPVTGKTVSASNYNQAVNEAGGQNLSGQFIPGQYSSSGTFTSSPGLSKTQVKAAVTSAVAANHYVDSNTAGSVSIGNNYNSTVNANGGQYINRTFVPGAYNDQGQYVAKTATGAAIYNNYEASRGSSATAKVATNAAKSVIPVKTSAPSYYYENGIKIKMG